MCDEDIHQEMIFNDPRLAGSRAAPLRPAGRRRRDDGDDLGLPPRSTVVEKDVVVKAGDSNVRIPALFYPEGNGQAPGHLGLWTRYHGPAPGVPRHGPPTGGRGLCGPGAQRLLPHQARAGDRSDGFQFPRDRALLPPIPKMDEVNRDATAFITYLDSLPQVDTKKKIGVQGHCMGGPFTFYTAATRADRVGAAITYHGGGIGTAMPNSPHLLIPQTKAEFLCCVAQNDDNTDPEAKNRLNAGFDAVKRAHHVEVYHADHGWTVPDSAAAYNKEEADRAYAAGLAVYKRNLV